MLVGAEVVSDEWKENVGVELLVDVGSPGGRKSWKAGEEGVH